MLRLLLTSVLLAAVTLAMLLLGILWQRWLDWEHVSSAESADGSMTANYFRSVSEVGHAPYGDHLVVESGGTFPTLFPGEVVFAGYCGGKMEYEWVEGPAGTILAIGCPEASEVETLFTEYRGVKLNVRVLRTE